MTNEEKRERAIKTIHDRTSKLTDRLEAYSIILGTNITDMNNDVRDMYVARAVGDICKYLAQREREERDKWIG